MSFHCAAYYSSVSATGSDTELAALQDQILTISNNRFLFRENRRLLWGSAIGTSVYNASISAPSFSNITTPYLSYGIEQSDNPTNLPAVEDWTMSPFNLAAREELSFRVSGTAGGVVEDNYGILGIEFNPVPAPRTSYYCLRGTSTTAAVANSWTELSVTWQNQLPAGRYAVVGGNGVSVGGIGFRFIIQDQLPRPGGLCTTQFVNQNWKGFSNGYLGNWGEFESFVMPGVEILNETTTADHTFYMTIAKIG